MISILISACICVGIKFQKVTWPMVRTMPRNKGEEGQICHYLETEHHCSIPAPKSLEVIPIRKQPRILYWAQ